MANDELLVVRTVKGAQPIFLSISNAAVGIGFTQISLVSESMPHNVALPVLSFTL